MENEKRLIEPTEYKSFLERYIKELCEIDAPMIAGAVEQCLRKLEAQPSADAVEVVHGYWIDSYSVDHIGRITEHSIDCSVCDSVFKDDSRAVVKHWKERFKVCPFCGAKMDGDGNG